MPLLSLLWGELFLIWWPKGNIVSNCCIEFHPTFLISSLDMGDSSASLGVSMTAWCIHSAMKGCHLTWLLPKVVCAVGSVVIMFPDSTLLVTVLLSQSLELCKLLFIPTMVSSSFHSTFNFPFPVQTPINIFLGQITHFVAHKLYPHMPRFFSLYSSPSGGFFPCG